MKYVIKEFKKLTTKELYEILKARAEIFVVEQECVYQDLDGIDLESVHVFYEEEGNIFAYLRVYPKKNEHGTVQIGRVLTRKHGQGLGRKLMEETCKFLNESEEVKRIFLEAQTYAIGFYEKFGFRVVSDEFLEDGIPHVQMEKVTFHR